MNSISRRVLSAVVATGAQFVAMADGETWTSRLPLQDDAHWARVNAAAREQARRPVRPGEPGARPFWNAHSKAFIHPPAFDFDEKAGAKQYRLEIVSRFLRPLRHGRRRNRGFPSPPTYGIRSPPDTMRLRSMAPTSVRSTALRCFTARIQRPCETTTRLRGAYMPPCTICRRCRAGGRATIRRRAMTCTAIQRR